MMDRRTFLKAVGASVVGVLLPAMPGLGQQEKLQTPFKGQSADLVIFDEFAEETNMPMDEFYYKLFCEKMDKAIVFGKGKSYEKTLLLLHETAFHKQMVEALDDAGFYGYGVLKVGFDYEM